MYLVLDGIQLAGKVTEVLERRIGRMHDIYLLTFAVTSDRKHGLTKKCLATMSPIDLKT